MIYSKILMMGIQKILVQKTYEMSVGMQSFNVDFLGVNRQFYWNKISLVYDKSNKHTTIPNVITLKSCSFYKIDPVRKYFRSLQFNKPK